MTRNEKKAVIESMAEKFMNIDDLEGKSMTIMVMSAYAEGKAGKADLEIICSSVRLLRERMFSFPSIAGCLIIIRCIKHGRQRVLQMEILHYILFCLCVFGISHFGLYYLYSSTKVQSLKFAIQDWMYG